MADETTRRYLFVGASGRRGVGASVRAQVYPMAGLVPWGSGVPPTPLALALPLLVRTLAERFASVGIMIGAASLWRKAAAP